MNEIVKFNSDTGVPVQITAQDVKNTLCPGATDKEVAMFLELCRAQRLNPWIKDAYLVKYGNGPASIITGKETFTKRANAHPDYEGFEAGVTFIDAQGNVRQREGSAVYKEAGEKLVGGWCRVFIKGRRPFYDEVTLAEYSTGKSMWAKAPATMVRKVALCHSLREAFPTDFQGLYSAEEMGNMGEVAQVMESAPAPAPLEAVAEVMASDDQLQDLAALVESFALMRGKTAEDVKCAVYASKSAQAAGIQPGAEMTAYQCETVCNVLSSWIEKAQAEQIAQGFEETQQPEPEQDYESEDIQF